MQIGFFVYQYAKLRMLQFYFGFLDKYLDRSDFQYCEPDTDSAYIALSGPSVESLVKPELKQEFLKDKPNWFPRTDSPEHKTVTKEHRGYLKSSGLGRQLLVFIAKLITVSGLTTNSFVKGLTKDVMRSKRKITSVFC